jgi:hypothetical protein
MARWEHDPATQNKRESRHPRPIEDPELPVFAVRKRAAGRAKASWFKYPIEAKTYTNGSAS